MAIFRNNSKKEACNKRLWIMKFSYMKEVSDIALNDATPSPKLGPRWPQLQECGSLGI